jgi:hypothetical protein
MVRWMLRLRYDTRAYWSGVRFVCEADLRVYRYGFENLTELLPRSQ